LQFGGEVVCLGDEWKLFTAQTWMVRKQSGLDQGCQIFHGTKYQKGEKYQITIKYTKWS
jgi:hypothetical protein